ncbi:MAG TPA: DUF305 domain-containing protein [Actinomycetes bacterium]
MPGRLGRWTVAVALLVAGCATAHQQPSTPAPSGGVADQADIWFMQHMVPHLWQTISITSLTQDRITHPALARLAATVTSRGQADIDQLQGWLAVRGLAPHVHSHQRVDSRNQTDLERLSQLRGTAFDLAFLHVVAARHRAGIDLAAAEVDKGSLPDARRLARRLLVEQRAQLRQIDTWEHAWSSPSGTAGH